MLTVQKFLPSNARPLSNALQISVLFVLLICTFSRLAQAETRVSEAEAKKNIISKVEPAFPPIAKQLNLSGRVEVDLYVGETGEVEKADPVSGNPILAGAAVNASKRWKFQPFESDGKPSKAIVRVAFNFVR